MKPVRYDGGALVCEDVALADIAAKTGTPCYVYSAATVLENYRAYDESLGHLHPAANCLDYLVKTC